MSPRSCIGLFPSKADAPPLKAPDISASKALTCMSTPPTHPPIESGFRRHAKNTRMAFRTVATMKRLMFQVENHLMMAESWTRRPTTKRETICQMRTRERRGVSP